MTSTLDPMIADDLFHGCAITAFVELARLAGGWPSSEATRRRSYALYEIALASKEGSVRERTDTATNEAPCPSTRSSASVDHPTPPVREPDLCAD